MRMGPLKDELESFLSSENINDKESLVTYSMKYEKESLGLFQKIITLVLTVVSSIIIGGSSFLLLDLIGVSEMRVTITLLSAGIYLVPGILLMRAKKELIGKTLVSTALILGMVISYKVDAISMWWILATCGVLFLSRSRWLSGLGYVVLMMIISICFFTHTPALEIEGYAQFLGALNVVLFMIAVRSKRYVDLIRDVCSISVLKHCSIVGFLLSLFILTFLKPSTVIYYGYNIGYFIMSTSFLVVAFKKETYKLTALFFWGIFLIYKYYDYLWGLLDKSISMITIGIVFVLFGVWVERRSRKYV